MKIAIGVPLPDMVMKEFLQNIIGIITTTSKLPQVDEVHYFDSSGVRTDRNRNTILQKIIEKMPDVDYILWLDADMLYPFDMVEKYIKDGEFDIMGCLYFKRSFPYDPVGYMKSNNPMKPYKNLVPDQLPKDARMVVDGLGFGGMMVNAKVYKAMGDDMWMKYGEEFHKPFPTPTSITHDLEFCQRAQEYGFTIQLHSGVKPGHVGNQVITEDTWRQAVTRRTPTISVIMPTIHPKLAKKTAKILKSRAGMEHKMIVIEDKDKSGFVALANQAAKDYPADAYVYLTDDIFPSRGWLATAYDTMLETGAGLVGFNDGKWDGAIATCGLVSHTWMVENYGGLLFYPDYFGHYNDTELTMLAMNDKMYAYNSASSLIEVDYEKDDKKVHKEDRELFEKRKASMFEGRVTDSELINKFG